MARSKQDKVQFIQELRNAADEVESANIEIPFRLLNQFSFKNCCAILSQDPNATNCAGFHEWRKVGRIVRKGSKGLAILVPMGIQADAKGTSERMRFSWRYVFDVTSTDPISADSPSTLGELMADA
jgi:hypothetical protein